MLHQWYEAYARRGGKGRYLLIFSLSLLALGLLSQTQLVSASPGGNSTHSDAYQKLPKGYVDPSDDGYLYVGGNSISGRVTDPWGKGIPGIWRNSAVTFVPVGSAGVDAVLMPRATITGQIVVPPPPIDDYMGIDVTLYSADTEQAVFTGRVGGLGGNMDGTFSFPVPTGDYKVLFSPQGSYVYSYKPTWYGGDSWRNAKKIRLDAGETSDSIIGMLDTV